MFRDIYAYQVAPLIRSGSPVCFSHSVTVWLDHVWNLLLSIVLFNWVCNTYWSVPPLRLCGILYLPRELQAFILGTTRHMVLWVRNEYPIPQSLYWISTGSRNIFYKWKLNYLHKSNCSEYFLNILYSGDWLTSLY